MIQGSIGKHGEKNSLQLQLKILCNILYCKPKMFVAYTIFPIGLVQIWVVLKPFFDLQGFGTLFERTGDNLLQIVQTNIANLEKELDNERR